MHVPSREFLVTFFMGVATASCAAGERTRRDRGCSVHRHPDARGDPRGSADKRHRMVRWEAAGAGVESTGEELGAGDRVWRWCGEVMVVAGLKVLLPAPGHSTKPGQSRERTGLCEN